MQRNTRQMWTTPFEVVEKRGHTTTCPSHQTHKKYQNILANDFLRADTVSPSRSATVSSSPSRVSNMSNAIRIVLGVITLANGAKKQRISRFSVNRYSRYPSKSQHLNFLYLERPRRFMVILGTWHCAKSCYQSGGTGVNFLFVVAVLGNKMMGL